LKKESITADIVYTGAI